MPTDTTADGEDIHPDFRSGAKLAGELASTFDEIRTTNRRSSGDRFTVHNHSTTGMTLGDMTAKAAAHGFRVSVISKDGRRLTFTRIENHCTDPRSD